MQTLLASPRVSTEEQAESRCLSGPISVTLPGLGRQQEGVRGRPDASLTPLAKGRHRWPLQGAANLGALTPGQYLGAVIDQVPIRPPTGVAILTQVVGFVVCPACRPKTAP
jgi:hypothetical protein